MKHTMDISLLFIGIALTFSVGLAWALRVDDSAERAPTSQNSQAHAGPEVEQERKQAEQQAEKKLDQEAIAAIEETKKAIGSLSENKNDEALAAIERATGKINILLARNPSTALIPVSLAVDVIDTAPTDDAAILAIAKDASRAVDNRDFPTARVLLYSLMSEIRVRIFNLPLGTYPVALKKAARLLDQKKADEAKSVLQDALNTLVAVDNVTPIPLVVARAAINEAQNQRQKDKNTAQKLLEAAKTEITRAKELGYASNDPEYAALNNEISNLQKQLNNGGETNSVFASVKQKLQGFLNRQSEPTRR